MPSPTPAVRRLHTLDERQIDQLADVLLDCVDGGASVGFMRPFDRERGAHGRSEQEKRKRKRGDRRDPAVERLGGAAVEDAAES